MFFKNAFIYRFSRKANLAKLSEQLENFKFTACGRQDKQSFGWVPPFGKHGTDLIHRAGNNLTITAQLETREVPAQVIKDAFNARVEQLERDEGRKLKKVEKDAIKDDVILDLLPRAFSRYKRSHVLIMADLDLVIVDAGSWNGAEAILALLRKTVGSLPVIPVTPKTPLEVSMTGWIKTGIMPAGFSIDDSCLELKSICQEGGIIRCKDQSHDSDEVRAHIEADKMVTKMCVDWQDRMYFNLSDDMRLSAIKWADELKEQNADIDREDKAARLDADFALMYGEFNALMPKLFEAVGGIDEGLVSDQESNEKEDA